MKWRSQSLLMSKLVHNATGDGNSMKYLQFCSSDSAFTANLPHPLRDDFVILARRSCNDFWFGRPMHFVPRKSPSFRQHSTLSLSLLYIETRSQSFHGKTLDAVIFFAAKFFWFNQRMEKMIRLDVATPVKSEKQKRLKLSNVNWFKAEKIQNANVFATEMMFVSCVCIIFANMSHGKRLSDDVTNNQRLELYFRIRWKMLVISLKTRLIIRSQQNPSQAFGGTRAPTHEFVVGSCDIEINFVRRSRCDIGLRHTHRHHHQRQRI